METTGPKTSDNSNDSVDLKNNVSKEASLKRDCDPLTASLKSSESPLSNIWSTHIPLASCWDDICSVSASLIGPEKEGEEKLMVTVRLVQNGNKRRIRY